MYYTVKAVKLKLLPGSEEVVNEALEGLRRLEQALNPLTKEELRIELKQSPLLSLWSGYTEIRNGLVKTENGVKLHCFKPLKSNLQNLNALVRSLPRNSFLAVNLKLSRRGSCKTLIAGLTFGGEHEAFRLANLMEKHLETEVKPSTKALRSLLRIEGTRKTLQLTMSLILPLPLNLDLLKTRLSEGDLVKVLRALEKANTLDKELLRKLLWMGKAPLEQAEEYKHLEELGLTKTVATGITPTNLALKAAHIILREPRKNTAR